MTDESEERIAGSCRWRKECLTGAVQENKDWMRDALRRPVAGREKHVLAPRGDTSAQLCTLFLLAACPPASSDVDKTLTHGLVFPRFATCNQSSFGNRVMSESLAGS